MPEFYLTFYQACFHKITVEAADAVEAEKIARERFAANPGFATTNARSLVRWSVEQAQEREVMDSCYDEAPK